MKKRWGTMLLAGLLGTALLSGCGSSASDSASSAAESNPSETTTTAEGTKEDLIFVNYRDIRDLNPHLYAGEMYAQEMYMRAWSILPLTVLKAVWQKAGMSVMTVKYIHSTFVQA